MRRREKEKERLLKEIIRTIEKKKGKVTGGNKYKMIPIQYVYRGSHDMVNHGDTAGVAVADLLPTLRVDISRVKSEEE